MSDLSDVWERAARLLGWRYCRPWSGWIKHDTPGPGEINFTILPTAEDACAVSGVMSQDEAQALLAKGETG